MTATPPDALLLLAPDCPHCPTVLDGLSRLLKNGGIGTLEVVNIAVRPDRAARLGVRTVPWTRIGELVLEGSRTPEELARWAAQAGTGAGIRAYVSERLKAGELTALERLVKQHPHWLAALLPLIADSSTELHVRIGLGALMESLQGDAALKAQLPALGELSAHPDHRVRSDACHYLALSRDPSVVPYLRARLQDEATEVREIAQDGLADLAAGS